MKKALQIAYLRAGGILPEGAVGRRPQEARRGGPRDQLPQLVILDACCQGGGDPPLFRARLGDRPRGSLCCLGGRRIRDLAGGELELRGRVLAEPLADLGGALGELERPDTVPRRHVHGAVAGDPRGPGVARDQLADGFRPGGEELRHPGCGPEARKLASNVALEPVHQAARTSPGVTWSTRSGSSGSAAALVAVISVWPSREIRSVRMRRRPGSSSDSTSSSRSRGGTLRRSRMISASPSR